MIRLRRNEESLLRVHCESSCGRGGWRQNFWWWVRGGASGGRGEWDGGDSLPVVEAVPVCVGGECGVGVAPAVSEGGKRTVLRETWRERRGRECFSLLVVLKDGAYGGEWA